MAASTSRHAWNELTCMMKKNMLLKIYRVFILKPTEIVLAEGDSKVKRTIVHKITAAAWITAMRKGNKDDCRRCSVE